MRRLGPNDGLTLLADELTEQGLVVTEVGLDHYFRAPDIDLRTVALTYAVLDELEQRAHYPRERVSQSEMVAPTGRVGIALAYATEFMEE